MAKPTLREETEIHEYDGYYTACDEQRFESLGSDMGNVTGCSLDSVYVGRWQISSDSRNGEPIAHGGIYWLSIRRPGGQHGY